MPKRVVLWMVVLMLLAGGAADFAGLPGMAPAVGNLSGDSGHGRDLVLLAVVLSVLAMGAVLMLLREAGERRLRKREARQRGRDTLNG